MIAGDRCTRACGFCAVTTAKPFALEQDEPERVAESVHRMKLRHVVITAGARDDLADRAGAIQEQVAYHEELAGGHARLSRSLGALGGVDQGSPKLVELVGLHRPEGTHRCR